LQPVKKKQAHLQSGDPADWGDAWVWRALALPSHLRVVTYLSHERSEEEATAFLAAFKARTDGESREMLGVMPPQASP